MIAKSTQFSNVLMRQLKDLCLRPSPSPTDSDYDCLSDLFASSTVMCPLMLRNLSPLTLKTCTKV